MHITSELRAIEKAEHDTKVRIVQQYETPLFNQFIIKENDREKIMFRAQCHFLFDEMWLQEWQNRVREPDLNEPRMSDFLP